MRPARSWWRTPAPGHPQGLYYVDAVKREGTLITELNCFLHCNIDHSGTWAVIDTAGTAYYQPGQARGASTEPDGRSIADIVLIHVPSGRQFWVARSHTKVYPYHAHPHLSPDARYLVYNDYQRTGAGSPSNAVVVELDTSVIV